MSPAQQKLLNDLLQSDYSKLSEWEVDFLEGLDANRRLDLTGPQEEKLNKLWTKTFP